MAIGLLWNYQVVELSGMPEQDEATLNPYGVLCPTPQKGIFQK
jgi:hypothetical protein